MTNELSNLVRHYPCLLWTEVEVTCSHRTPAGQTQQTFLLQDETRADESTGGHGERQTDVEVHAVHLHLKRTQRGNDHPSTNTDGEKKESVSTTKLHVETMWEITWHCLLDICGNLNGRPATLLNFFLSLFCHNGFGTLPLLSHQRHSESTDSCWAGGERAWGPYDPSDRSCDRAREPASY